MKEQKGVNIELKELGDLTTAQEAHCNKNITRLLDARKEEKCVVYRDDRVIIIDTRSMGDKVRREFFLGEEKVAYYNPHICRSNI